MKVFISHAGGGKSLEAATMLQKWLSQMIQSLRPWMSHADIAPGVRWATELQSELRDSKYGILCVTRTNPAAPWLLFEAGSLAKALDDTFVVPLLIDIKREELPSPLTQFHSVDATKEGLRRIIEGINQLVDPPLSESALDTQFELVWPNVDDQLRALREEDLDTSPGANPFTGTLYVSVGELMLEDSAGGIDWDNEACFLVRERDGLKRSVSLVATPGGGSFEVEMDMSLRSTVEPQKSYELLLADTAGQAWRVPPFFLYHQAVTARLIDPPANDGGE